MFHRLLITAATAAALSAPAGGALAADLAVAPPPPAPVSCFDVHNAPVVAHHKHKQGSDYQRIYDVAPYDPRCPQQQPAGVYVPPQAAYLVSSPTRFTECVWPCADSVHHDWYDGRLWYYNAGTPNRPDVFMVLQKD
jgi:hypothetical protein